MLPKEVLHAGTCGGRHSRPPLASAEAPARAARAQAKPRNTTPRKADAFVPGRVGIHNIGEFAVTPYLRTIMYGPV